MDKISLGDRIKQLRKSQNLTQQAFAKALGISAGYVSEIEQGNKMPGSEVLLSLKQVFHINTDWLLTGEGEMERGKKEKPLMVCEEPAIYYKEGDFIYVPMVSGKISAGGGLIPETTVELKLAFRRDWIQRHGDPRNMSLIRVSGDSMEPTLYSGDVVLVDHNRNYIDPQGGIYAIAMDDIIMIKRLQVIYPGKKIRIISDNPKYEHLEAEPEQVIIIGKVIWFGREIER